MAQTTEPGPNFAQTMDEKRNAMLRHLIGQHHHPDNTHYKSCSHGPVQNRRMDPG